jgi:DHA1 family bicyclomycin/chloramphenicol resistance-like MFS transporter
LIACLGLNFSAFFIYVLASPVFLVEHLHLSSQQFGFLFIPTVTGMMIGSWISRHSAGKISPNNLLRWSFAWMVIIATANVGVQLWAMHTIHHMWWLAIIPIALFNIGMAASMPVLSIAALDCFPKVRGTAASAQAFMQMLCSTISSAVIVPLIWDSPVKLAGTMLCMTLLSAGLLWMARNQFAAVKPG